MNNVGYQVYLIYILAEDEERSWTILHSEEPICMSPFREEAEKG